VNPGLAGDYGAREVLAVRQVLVELGQVLGSYRGKFVVVGGAVPWLLFPQANPSHVGTLDIDLDLDPEKLAEGQYAEMVALLEESGYERSSTGLQAFQMRRNVKVDDGPEIAVVVDLLMPLGAKTKKNRPPKVPNLRVQQASGGGLPLRFYQEIEVSGLMPDGRQNQVVLAVASIPAFLAMKGFALVGRNKKKDAYDIYYSVRNYEGGPQQLAQDCQPLLGFKEGLEGYKAIACKFRSGDDYGPTTVRMFLQQSDALGDMSAEQVQLDAFRQVKAWLDGLNLDE
jgi:hypothetical protein